MDQKKTNCPSLGKQTKDEPPLVQQVIGVKVHGIKTYAFICDETVRKGANLICEILHRVLCDLDKIGKLPSEDPVLYLQNDNCGENKNKTLFAFLVDLVRRKIFAKVKAVFFNGWSPMMTSIKVSAPSLYDWGTSMFVVLIRSLFFKK